ncbi:PREDICTED: olfactory receptor 6Y1 [Dipodomys ordii]|uniref:Olfactory receptor 6Y1 n=1 Tax=Dipodomys ordii TaxID=10020 RepID=A0A1S3GAV5_DIPOR|nr:PREDICTED: olfactory receptor 6Y1 [Dipodomys ordii]
MTSSLQCKLDLYNKARNGVVSLRKMVTSSTLIFVLSESLVVEVSCNNQVRRRCAFLASVMEVDQKSASEIFSAMSFLSGERYVNLFVKDTVKREPDGDWAKIAKNRLQRWPAVIPKALEVGNLTSTTHFILLGFPTRPAFQLLLFSVFLATYLLTLLENLLIILAIRSDGQLHKPMYFFLSHLSFLEMWYVTVISPKMLADFLRQDKSISFCGCMTQLYFFVTFVCTEYILLAVMAFDRYVAICNPLRYPVIMTNQLCGALAGGCWLCGLLTAMVKMVFIARLLYCGTPRINHYFCDISPLLNVSCQDSSQAELVDFFLALLVIAVPLCVVVTSYITILATILKIPSAQGRQKAFSTCASHLAVVALFYSTTLFTYARPKLMYAYSSNKVVSLLYTVLVPLLNPIIYCLRNREVKAALQKTVLCGGRGAREESM